MLQFVDFLGTLLGHALGHFGRLGGPVHRLGVAAVAVRGRRPVRRRRHGAVHVVARDDVHADVGRGTQ